MDAKQMFEKAIARQEVLVQDRAHKMEWETDDEFNAKVAQRIKMVCVGLGHARDIPGINGICLGLDADWEGYHIERRRVDQLDNVYVSRAK